MRMAARAHEPLVLSAGERNRLAEWAAQASGRQAARAAIVLASAEGQPDTRVADQAGVSRATVAKWRARFAAARLAGLQDLPRPGTPRKITDA
jgi:transposase